MEHRVIMFERSDVMDSVVIQAHLYIYYGIIRGTAWYRGRVTANGVVFLLGPLDTYEFAPYRHVSNRIKRFGRMNRLFVGIVFLLSFKHNTFDVTYKDKDKNRGIRLIGENALLPKRIVFPSGKYMWMFWLKHADVFLALLACSMIPLRKMTVCKKIVLFL